MKKAKHRSNNFVVYIAAAIFVVVLATLIAYHLYFKSETKILKMELIIGDKTAFKVDDDAIYFGTVYPGSTSKRAVVLNNSYDYPVFVVIKTFGNISQFVFPSENNFRLMPGEEKTISYYATSKEDSLLGKYTGETSVVFTRENFLLQ